MQIFGVTISRVSHEELLLQVKNFLTEAKFHRIATVNPEFLVLADRNEAFKKSLQAADICVADGMGVVLVAWFQGKRVTRFPGADLLHEILTVAEHDGHPVFLALKKDGLSSYEEIHDALLKKYPQLSVSGSDDELGGIENWKLEIGNSAMVLCNFGAPQQEVFLDNLKTVGTNTRLVIGVGGALDFLTGKQKRAPKPLRALGLEWLWRLMLQPSRFKRIWTAIIIFPCLVFYSWQKNKKRL
jgi:N-acetylglucosaminyldiphosphoundecaprenol N-acetyl-beta-D-mannosaminyltransferase